MDLSCNSCQKKISSSSSLQEWHASVCRLSPGSVCHCSITAVTLLLAGFQAQAPVLPSDLGSKVGLGPEK